MSKKEKQFYCKLGQAVYNTTLTLLVMGGFTFYIVYGLLH